MAKCRLAESELYSGKEDIFGISFIRIYRLNDGRIKTFLAKDELDKNLGAVTTIDPELYCLAVKQGDKFVGVVLNYATHPATIADDLITGDYISALSDRMKEYYGKDFVTVFINGACGDINHIDYYGPKRESTEIYRTVGYTLADGVRTIINRAEPMTDNTVKVLNKTVTAKFRKPTAEDLVAFKEYFDSLGDELINSTPRGSGNYRKTHFALQAFLIMADKRTVCELPLQLIKLGNCYIAGTSGQIFNAFGKRIKAACGGLCFVSAFANDYSGYVPTPECMVPGVYEATLAKTRALEPATGDIIVSGITEMLAEIEK